MNTLELVRQSYQLLIVRILIRILNLFYNALGRTLKIKTGIT